MSNVAIPKTEVPIARGECTPRYQLPKLIEEKFQRPPLSFEVNLYNGMKTGSGKSNLTAPRVKVPISQLVDKI